MEESVPRGCLAEFLGIRTAYPGLGRLKECAEHYWAKRPPKLASWKGRGIGSAAMGNSTCGSVHEFEVVVSPKELGDRFVSLQPLDPGDHVFDVGHAHEIEANRLIGPLGGLLSGPKADQ